MIKHKKFGFLSHLDLNLYLFRTPIMRELLQSGNIVYAICPKGEYNQSLSEVGVIVVNYEIDRKSINPFAEKKVIENIYIAIKNLRLDILHTFTAKPNIYGTFAGKRANIPVILNLVEGLGSFYVHNSIKNIIIRTIMERLYKKAFALSNGVVFVNNEDSKYMISKKIIDKNMVKVIKSVGVDITKFNLQNFSQDSLHNIKLKIGLQDKLIILMVARAIWDKGIREYYECADILKSKYSNIEFLLVGGTDNGNHACIDIDFLNSGSVKWLGHRDDIVELTAICDIYVLPSYKEGLPVTLMEASAMSKPIVTTSTTGCREVVKDGYNGFLVPVKSSVELSKKIEILITNKDLRDTMGKNSRLIAQKEFDVKKIVKQYVEYYEKSI